MGFACQVVEMHVPPVGRDMAFLIRQALADGPTRLTSLFIKFYCILKYSLMAYKAV